MEAVSNVRKKVLLVCYGGGHVNMLIPVLKQLQADGQVAPVSLALSIAKTAYFAHGLPFKTVADYKDLIMDADAEYYGELLADRWHVESSGLAREESVVYFGTSMRDLVNDVGEIEAFRQTETFGRQCFLPLWTMEQIIEAEQPDLILTTNSPRMERAAALVGNRRDIPTINLHDDLGFIKRDYLLTGDRIAVMSEITKENLIAQGHVAEKIVVTGHPAFDTLPDELLQFKREEMIHRLNLPNNRPYLLLGSSQPGMRGKVMEMCPLTCDAVKQLGGFHLIVKPHPGEDADAYRDYARKSGNDITVISGVNIRELIAVSELLITFASTIMIESLLMGKPVISLNLTGDADPLPFVKWGMGVEARTRDQLQVAIRLVLSDEQFRRNFNLARQHYFGGMVDGKASKRVADLVYRMIGERCLL